MLSEIIPTRRVSMYSSPVLAIHSEYRRVMSFLFVCARVLYDVAEAFSNASVLFIP